MIREQVTWLTQSVGVWGEGGPLMAHRAETIQDPQRPLLLIKKYILGKILFKIFFSPHDDTRTRGRARLWATRSEQFVVSALCRRFWNTEMENAGVSIVLEKFV